MHKPIPGKPGFDVVMPLIRSRQYTLALTYLADMKPTPEVLYARSSCYFKTNQYQLAIDAIAPIAHQQPKYLERLAECYAKKQEYVKAIDLFSKLQIISDSGLYHYACALISKNEIGAAIPILIRIKEKDNTVLLAMAHCYEVKSNYPAAIDAYRKMIRPDVATLVKFSHCYAYQGKHKQALDVLKDIKSNEEVFILALGRRYENLEFYHQASNVYSEFLKAFPANKPVASALAQCHRKAGQVSISIAQTKALLEKSPDDPELLMRLALSYEDAGKCQLAIDTLGLITNPANSVRVALARCLNSADRSQEALVILESLPKDYVEGQVGLAICHNKMNNYDEAIAITLAIPSWDTNRRALLNLARSYEGQNNFSDAYQALKRIPNWQEDSEAVLTMARCYQAEGNLVASEEVLTGLERKDNTITLALARCKQAMGDLEAAQKLLCAIPNFKESSEIVLALAHCYEEMGQYHQAIECYQSLSENNHQKMNLSFCFEKMGDYDNAVLILNSITPLSKNVQLTLGRIYQAIGMFSQALTTFQSIIGYEQDKDALLAIGICYAESGKQRKAIIQLTAIPEWQDDRLILLALARCYRDLKDYQQAIDCVQMITNWKRDEQAVLTQAITYSRFGKSSVALELLEQTLKIFPFSKNIHYVFARTLFESRRQDSLVIIENCIRKFPFFVQFYLLKASYENHMKSRAAVAIILENAIKLFPFNLNLYINLLRHYLFVGNHDKAQAMYQSCLKRFRGNPKLASTLSGLMRAAHFVPEWQEDFMVEQTDFEQFKLPEVIQVALNLIKGITQESYIVGSAVLSVLEGIPLNANKDIDLVALTQNLGHFTCVIRSKGLLPNDNIKQLFTGRLPSPPHVAVDCYAVSLPIETRPFVQSNSILRDFTVCCLYLDSEGNVIDPTGLGLSDFREKILRPIVDAKSLFAKDPVRILRAIKYMIRGYTPTSELVAALNDWQPNSLLNKQHLYAVAREQLSFDATGFVSLLLKFNLLQKLFNITPEGSIELSKKGLLQVINQSTVSNPLFWNQPISMASNIISKPKPPLVANIETSSYPAQVNQVEKLEMTNLSDPPECVENSPAGMPSESNEWPCLPSKNEKLQKVESDTRAIPSQLTHANVWSIRANQSNNLSSSQWVKAPPQQKLDEKIRPSLKNG